MTTVQLNPEEVNALLDILDNYVANIHAEIHHTDNFDYRQILERRAVTVRKILADLRMAQSNLETG